ncbi:forespore capture DNA-binding protein RefZ [Bacillus megaterium]|nr:forespore capture DNA-binding protein RefZ [Priestia megaterium]
MAVQSKTKEKIIDAAVSLFNVKGFDGTSVREIAGKAKVNVANISYYFHSKEGLLESLVISYFEGYIGVLEQAFQEMKKLSSTESMIVMIRAILHYQHENRHIARLVYREISLDTILIREVMTTYLTKEKYYLKTILERGMKEKEFRKSHVSFTIIELKGMLSMPYLHPQYLSEVLHILPHEPYFVQQYAIELERWVHTTVCLPYERTNKLRVQLS